MRGIFSDGILFKNYLFRLDPLEELSSETIPFTGSAFFQTISFAETAFANLILYRNCRCRPYPLQELSLQIKFPTHRNRLFALRPFKKLILGNHNLSGKASLQLFFTEQHYSSHLNIQHKFHFVFFSDFFIILCNLWHFLLKTYVKSLNIVMKIYL